MYGNETDPEPFHFHFFITGFSKNYLPPRHMNTLLSEFEHLKEINFFPLNHWKLQLTNHQDKNLLPEASP